MPITRWIQDSATFKYVGDNVSVLKGVRNITSGHQAYLHHMYSLLVVKNRITPPPPLAVSCRRTLRNVTADSLLPTSADIASIKLNLSILVCRIICKYIKGLKMFAHLIPQHIHHTNSKLMAQKSEVAVIDVLHKNEACHVDMLEIMKTQQMLLGQDFNDRVISGGDQLTCERQRCAQLHVMDSDTPAERLELLEPAEEDWHGLMNFFQVNL